MKTYAFRCLCAVMMLLLSRNLSAQLGAPAQGAAGSQAAQLPLSGRSQQGGSVAATQTPIPGTTSSINTLNTTAQVQGPYAGSSLSRTPFKGKLSLLEAVQRGLGYN